MLKKSYQEELLDIFFRNSGDITEKKYICEISDITKILFRYGAFQRLITLESNMCRINVTRYNVVNR